MGSGQKLVRFGMLFVFIILFLVAGSAVLALLGKDQASAHVTSPTVSNTTQTQVSRDLLAEAKMDSSAASSCGGQARANGGPGTDLCLDNHLASSAQTVVVDTGNVYFIGDAIPVPVSSPADTIDYTLERILVDRDGISGEVYTGKGTVSDTPDLGRVAFLPTSMVTRKGVYYLSGGSIPRHRVLLVDPVPDIQDPRDWPFGLITSRDKLDQGAAMAEEFYRVGIRWFHFDYPISNINDSGASSDPDAGRISTGFEAFVNRAAERGINPIFKLMNHYSQIASPTNLNGDFYQGLRKIQTYYKGKLGYWTIGNEVEGGGYSQFTPEEYATVIKNMSIALKGVDPDVRIIAGEFYGGCDPNPSTHCGLLLTSAYRDYWDILSGHNMVRINAGNAPVSDYLDGLDGLEKPVWDTEANGTMFGGPSEWSAYMQSDFPVVEDADLHSGINKHIARVFCLETWDGNQWLPAFYNPNQPCLGADLFIAMHYNASWETQWALRRHWISDVDQPSEPNEKIVSFRTVADMLYGTEGVTRIPNTDVADPYDASPTATYERADGYVFQYGTEYVLMLWQNSADSSQDRELVLKTDDPVVLYDSLGNRYPLRNDGGQVKVWVAPDAVYVRGFTSIPTFELDETGADLPYFVTTPITQAVVGRPYFYNAWAYDSDVPSSGEDSLARITYELVDAPAGMVLAANTSDTAYAGRTALLAWTPTTPGTYNVRIRAASQHGDPATVDQVFTVSVVPAGSDVAPQIVSEPTTLFGRAGYRWWYNVNAHDPNGDAITYALTQAPDGMTVDPESGFIQWTPRASGIYPVVVAASDGTAPSTQRFTLQVGGVAPPPPPMPLEVEKSAQPQVATRGETVTFTITISGTGQTVTVTDPLPDALSYVSSETDCPLGAIDYDADRHTVTYTGAPGTSTSCVVQIVTRVDVSRRQTATNTASVATGSASPLDVSATVALNPILVNLPLILKRR